MLIHLVNRFENALGGSERAALQLHAGLRDRADVRLWATATPHAGLSDHPIRVIGADGDAPRGGTLVIVGNYFELGPWLDACAAERRILNYNTVVGPALKYAIIDRLRSIGPLEILYESPLVRQSVAIPGPVFLSDIDLARFHPRTAPAASAAYAYTVGRLSRDTPEKHHPEDIALYRRLADAGLRVRIMGGTCLAGAPGADPRIELLPAGAMPAEDFLRGLDCFLYRTSEQWTEAGGRVIFEALASGLPVICHARGGYAHWIRPGRNGQVFASSDEACAQVLALARDPALQTSLAQGARASAEALFSPEARENYLRYFLDAAPPSTPLRRTRPRVDLAWELGAHTGHVATLLPVGLALAGRGIEPRFLLRDPSAGSDLAGVNTIARVAAPVWIGPARTQAMRNFGEILDNFGYGDAVVLRQLIEAWRERLDGSAAVIASASPAAHLAARTLGIPSFELSEGFHVPPPTLPTPLLRDWLSVDPAELEAIDRRVLNAMNRVLHAHRAAPLATLGDLYAGRSLLLTYPELDLYTQRGMTEYFGIPQGAEGTLVPDWPAGTGPRVFAYLYGDHAGLAPLCDALQRLNAPTLMLCRGAPAALKARCETGCVRILESPMSVAHVLPGATLAICHGSHQMTAQALLAGKPVLLLPTQLEQYLKTRRVASQGMGLGISADEPRPDYIAALEELAANRRYADAARAFASRYAPHDRGAALRTIVERCLAAIRAGGNPAPD